MSKYINITSESYGESITSRFVDVRTNYEFNMYGHTLSINATEIEAQHYYNILSCVLTLGYKYWHNFCYTGGKKTLDFHFIDFIEKNIKLVDRDIKIEKIID